ncbi:MAG: hypothetical protein ABEI39_03750 [Halobacteriales archaeon]
MASGPVVGTMSVLEKIQDLVPGGDSGPNGYECPECGRTFEADAPPERVVCSACGNQDVQRRDG